MKYQTLIQKIKSFGAFIPEKFYDLASEENRKLGERVFEEYSEDISLSTGGLYLAMILPVREGLATLVKKHFTTLKNLTPQDAVQINNKAFAYDTFGFYHDPFNKSEPWKRIADDFGIDGFRSVQPMYEEAIARDPTLWEPRYNLANGLIGLWTWREDSEHDDKDFERAFEELNEILERDPRNIPARLRLASIYYDYVNPYQLYGEVLEIDPYNKEAKEGIEGFRKAGFDFGIHSTVSMAKKIIPGPVDPNMN
jgi:tetratricopeptide (TPR) repeat protein